MMKRIAKLLASWSEYFLKREDRDSLDLAAYLPNKLSQLEPGSATIDELIRMIAVCRERAIEVIAIPLPIGLYGVRLAGPTKDYIVHESRTPRVHQDHIKAHELAHILAGHRVALVTGDTSVDSELAALLFRSAEADSYEEREAEALATAIQAEIIRIAGLKALTGQLSTSEMWSNMIRGLGID